MRITLAPASNQGLPWGRLSEPPGENEEESITLCLSGDEPDVKAGAGDVEMDRKQPSPAPLLSPRPLRGRACLEVQGRALPTILLKVSVQHSKSVESSGLPGTSQQHFARSSACPFDKGITQGDLKTDYAPFPGNYGQPHMGQKGVQLHHGVAPQGTLAWRLSVNRKESWTGRHLLLQRL